MRATIAIVCFCSTLVAQEPARFTDAGRAARVKATVVVVDSIFDEYRTSQHMPGLVYGVVLDGELLFAGQFGKANLEADIDADARSLFRIASMSKSFTAMAIMQLRDAGKLSLDDPAEKYIPEMKGINPLFDDAPAITIRHLLTHGAGFPEDNPWGDRQLAESEQMLTDLMKNGPSLSNVPGVAYEYSNTGFALLGLIVERVSGMDFQEYTSQYIFRILGMTSTVWEWEKADPKHLALGYNWIDEGFANIPLEHHGSFGAMGGLITSIEDFAKYMAFHLAAWPPRNDPEWGPLRRSSAREMHHPWRIGSIMNMRQPDGSQIPAARAYGYGLGWTQKANGRTYIGHSGGLPGFGSNWTMMPEYGLAIMSFDNRTYGGTSTINEVILDSIIALAGLEPRNLPVSEILKKRSKQLAEMLPDWKGAESSGLFAENFFLDNRLKDLVKQSGELYERAGTIRGVGEMKPMNQLRGTFRLYGERKDIAVFFTLTPEKDPKIQQVRMRAVEKE